MFIIVDAIPAHSNHGGHVEISWPTMFPVKRVGWKHVFF